MVLTDVAIAGLSRAMEGLTSTLNETIEFSKKADKASLALGMSFGQASDKLGGSMEGLRGSLTDRFGAAIATLEAGLQGNTRGIALLSQQQKLTGVSNAKTIKTMAALENALDVSREETNKLSVDIIEMGKQYGVSTDVLVESISNLSKSFPAAELAGMGSEMTEAVASLQAELGPALSGPLNTVMTAIMDTSQQGFEDLIKLGLGDVREQLAASKSAEQSNQILKDAIKTAAATTKDFGGGADKFFRQAGIVEENLGKASLVSIQLAKALEEGREQNGEATDDFFNQIDIMKAEALIPLQQLFAEMFIAIKPFLPEIRDLVANQLTKFADFIRGFFADIGGFRGAIILAQAKFVEFKDSFVKFTTENMPAIIKTATLLVGAFVALKAIVLAFQVAAIIPFKLLLTALLVPLKIIVGGILALTGPIGLVVAGVAALGALLYKFGVFDPLIEGVKKAFTGLKNGLGKFLEGLGDMIPDWLGGGKISEMGKSLQKSIEDNTKVTTTVVTTTTELAGAFSEQTREGAIGNIEQRMKRAEAQIERRNQLAEDGRIKERTANRMNRVDQRLLSDLKIQLRDIKNMSAQEFEQERQERQAKLENRKQQEDAYSKTNDHLGKIVDNTKKDTESTFLSETANMLGGAIESILGIGTEDPNEAMIEELRGVRFATETIADKDPAPLAQSQGLDGG